MKDLYKANTGELLQALREGGFNQENIASRPKIYEATDGTLKASLSPNDIAENGKCESIGFWLWCSFEEYVAAQDNAPDDIVSQIDAGFAVNLQALKELLKEFE